MSRLRLILALVLIGTFGSRVAAAGVVVQCAAGMENPQHSGPDHDGGKHQHPQSPNLPACECVGHSCSTAIAMLSPGLSLAAAGHGVAPLHGTAPAELLRSYPDYLLPFAHGPPVSASFVA